MSLQEVSETIVRHADVSDVSPTMTVLLEISAEIPLRLDGRERKDRIRELIRNCFESGESIVATGAEGNLIGFQLTRPIPPRLLTPSGPKQRRGLMLEYGGVVRSARGKGIFSALIARTKVRQLPLYAIVRHDNQSGMARRLSQMGFRKIDTDSDFPQDHFRWLPKRPATKVNS